MPTGQKRKRPSTSTSSFGGCSPVLKDRLELVEVSDFELPVPHRDRPFNTDRHPLNSRSRGRASALAYNISSSVHGPGSTSERSSYTQSRRRKIKDLLLGPNAIGLSCDVINGYIAMTIGGKIIETPPCNLSFTLSQTNITPSTVPNSTGHAKWTSLKLTRNGGTVCQPTGATPASSYILNKYKVSIEQCRLDGTLHRYRYEPSGAYVTHGHWPSLFAALADMITVDVSESLLHAALAPAESASARYLSGIAVRLREGGSRLPLRATPNGMSELSLPYGSTTQSRILEVGGRPPQPVNKTIPVVLNISANLVSPQDLIFCAAKGSNGSFETLRYALVSREYRGSIKSWRDFRPAAMGVPAWFVALLIIAVRHSQGCHRDELMKVVDVKL